MKPTSDDVIEMVKALFTLTGSLERARRQKPDAAILSVLQVIAAHGTIRPSEIADELSLHQSTITRHVQALQKSGWIEMQTDPDDSRSFRILLSEAGIKKMEDLREVGLRRFSSFVKDWEAEEVREFTRLLTKLEESKNEVARSEEEQVPQLKMKPE